MTTAPDLFTWADARAARAARARRGSPPRLILLPDAITADGTARAGLLHPGARLPVVFASLPAALAALANLEAHA